MSNERVDKVTLIEKTADNMWGKHLSGIASTCFTIASFNPDDSFKLTASFTGAAIISAIGAYRFLQREKESQYQLDVAQRDHVIHAF